MICCFWDAIFEVGSEPLLLPGSRREKTTSNEQQQQQSWPYLTGGGHIGLKILCDQWSADQALVFAVTAYSCNV